VKYSSILSVTVIDLCLTLFTIPVLGQQFSGADNEKPADVTGIAAKTETTPANDAVLAIAPRQLLLSFPERVRLVKLTLHNELRNWVDINFRYDPSIVENITWSLPSLQSATYYTADWAILAANEQLIKGTFSFAFGPGAEAPSVTKQAEALLLDLSNGRPRRGQSIENSVDIIINRDPPTFDPPFTIQLDDDSRQNRQ
jgi:methionine-rich copper-binding protein CopC